MPWRGRKRTCAPVPQSRDGRSRQGSGGGIPAAATINRLQNSRRGRFSSALFVCRISILRFAIWRLATMLRSGKTSDEQGSEECLIVDDDLGDSNLTLKIGQTPHT